MRTRGRASLPVLGAVLVACSATEERSDFDSEARTGGSSTRAGPSAGGAGLLTVGSGAVTGTGGSTTCGPPCSTDLHEVLDCEGNVVGECSDDDACAEGVCIDDPCKAAELSKSSYGCDFWALKIEMIGEGDGACFAAFIANTWTVPVHIAVEYDGQALPVADFTRIPHGQGPALTYAPYDPVAGLGVGNVAIVFLSQAPPSDATTKGMPPCPAPPALATETAVIGTGFGTGFHITTDRPVTAYQIVPYGGGHAAITSATLLLPTNTWDTNYIAIQPYPTKYDPFDRSLSILAREAATEVTLVPKVALVGSEQVPPAPGGQLVSYTLGQGQYLQITQNQELTGTVIESTKPVAVWGAAPCMRIPEGVFACDSGQQQIPPIKTFGSEYAGVRYRGRDGGVDEATPWQLVGAVHGTELTWEPPQQGAPTTIGLGVVVEFNATGPFVVRSQDADHPFYLAQYMTGGLPFQGEGDPEWVNVTPIAQYLDSYVLFTDPTYSETELVVVRRPGDKRTFADVTLDCAGVLSEWQPLGPYEFTRVELVTGYFENVGNCGNGRHSMQSALPFGVTVWGWGNIPGWGADEVSTQWVSYAYPGGRGLRSLNDVVVPPK